MILNRKKDVFSTLCRSIMAYDISNLDKEISYIDCIIFQNFSSLL